MTTFLSTLPSDESAAGVRDYWQLLKPRVMSLVIFTGICGGWMAPMRIHPIIALMAIICLATGAGGAGCLNMWLERHYDEHMKRTQSRPLVTGIVDNRTALAFGMILSIGSVVLMAITVNYVAAFWLMFTIFFYTIIYTLLLKRRTSQNIVIGGLSGALPPVIGWAAVAGNTPIEAWILCAIIFFWTPAHFWSLALSCVDDYNRVGIPMLPCVKGNDHTCNEIIIYTLLTSIISIVAPLKAHMVTATYVWISLSLSLIFIVGSVLLKIKKMGNLSFFSLSIAYLFLIFLSLVLCR